MKNCLVYLSGPIAPRHGFTVEENVAAGVRAYLDCLKVGIPAFCPHLGAAFPSAHSDVDYETWMAYDFAVIDRCTHLLMLPRWDTSSGAQRERTYAASLGLPVYVSFHDLQQALDSAVWARRDRLIAP